MKHVWILFGVYYIEDHYKCEDIVSVHEESHSAHLHKEFLEKYSEAYDAYKIRQFEVLRKKD